jgi:deoxyadenosine/deoxycytidine kinase
MSPESFEPNYIAVEGVIGAGKTSFAKMLAERIDAELVAEEVLENPFLVDFYKNPKRYAPTLALDIPRPDLVIYLQASTHTLLERIRRRNFGFEKTIDFDYIELINKAYDYYFFDYSETPLLVVKTDEIDFVHNPVHFDDLIEQLKKPIAGKKYYAPAGNLVSE